jgi:ankyrin repeat protein
VGTFDLNRRNMVGLSLLSVAICAADVEVVELLLQGGADIGLIDKNGYNLLQLACLENVDPHIVRLLVERQPSLVQAKTEDGLTLLHVAAACSDVEILRMLIEKGVDEKAAHDKVGTCLHVAASAGKLDNVKFLVHERGFDPLANTIQESSTLHLAAQVKSPDVAEFLLVECGANINAKDSEGCTPLMIASSIASPDMCRFLVDHGADLALVDKDGDDAFLCACSGGIAENVEFLLSLAKFDTSKKNFEGKTGLQYAVEKGHAQVVELLKTKKKSRSRCFPLRFRRVDEN